MHRDCALTKRESILLSIGRRMSTVVLGWFEGIVPNLLDWVRVLNDPHKKSPRHTIPLRGHFFYTLIVINSSQVTENHSYLYNPNKDYTL